METDANIIYAELREILNRVHTSHVDPLDSGEDLNRFVWLFEQLDEIIREGYAGPDAWPLL